MEDSMPFSNIEKRHLVSWDGTASLYVVVENTDSWFEIMDRDENRYRCYPSESRCLDLQTDTEQSIEGFRILGEVYDIITWTVDSD